MPSLRCTNARLVTPDGVVHGSLTSGGGLITGIDAPGAIPEALDFKGDYLLPGLVEIHTDNIEKHFLPRSGVRWPTSLTSIMAHDTHMVGAGITTVLDAVSAGEFSAKRMRREIFAATLEALALAMDNKLLRAEHLLHIRCELADRAVVEMFTSVMDHKLLRLVSIMDHTPGQRQWSDLEKYRAFHADRKWTDEELLAEIDRLRTVQASHAEPNRETILDLCRERSLPLASHDDTTVEHVEETARLGMRIAEFPTTREAVLRARELGLAIVMGAPNVVRGESHSGNVSALALAGEDLVDILSSDYMPASLLQAPFIMSQKLDLPLHRTLRTVTANPAMTLGLADRGELVPGKRADLVRVRLVDEVPVVIAVWREGRQVM
ncbi:MAG: alpha-D-ribose 1-methylphosphonate 5-triphosphate diphosphatase [Desulfomicrobium sp.]|nr:alpha-D-ribose 1-methylphosphonate 5-triphosphate diphosphatase [Pseudomonadota bacterium]MBV1710664.1 alpha-D-ribose 1-methylphosphonate 5-triphosphate diphosphatase [Desulfomicrobium sp.]MBU4570272.1 alpha-D-ribose 1-methylphosphonate 5-triphosphate diphosphatase [Pseudomonadota bacterium]MBU4593192.1 alpha-D-ribose 1-methylphosphonate 5-triphosphate diphosphatase [Pseudomonadota bacterium]MBV1720324.1 alpha-D-ribose 1-methylphosphonate 5-triphosphate diphosphatase [Desulfomicrobium sp.]